MWSDKVLVAVAKFLCLYHDATLGFQPPADAHWQCRRLELFCDAYELNDSVQDVIEMADRRLSEWVFFIQSRAAAGDEAQQRVFARGDVSIYEGDHAYIKKHFA